MNEAASKAPRPILRRLLRLAAILALLLLACVLLAGWLLQPQRAGAFLLRKLGNELGLEINAGSIDYRLRGTPQLVLRDVAAKHAGDAPLLQAKRVFVSLPWSTLRARFGLRRSKAG